jgi:hypothetical protein
MNSPVFWDITPCSPLKLNRVSEVMSLPFSGSKCKPSNPSSARYLLQAGFMPGLFFDP